MREFEKCLVFKVDVAQLYSVRRMKTTNEGPVHKAGSGT